MCVAERLRQGCRLPAASFRRERYPFILYLLIHRVASEQVLEAVSAAAEAALAGGSGQQQKQASAVDGADAEEEGPPRRVQKNTSRCFSCNKKVRCCCRRLRCCFELTCCVKMVPGDCGPTALQLHIVTLFWTAPRNPIMI